MNQLYSKLYKMKYKLIKDSPFCQWTLGTIKEDSEWQDLGSDYPKEWPSFFEPIKEPLFVTYDGVNIYEGIKKRFRIMKSTYNYNLIPEFKFHDTRKWRFDFALVNEKIAIEIEGGAYTNGRHTRGKGFIADMEKYNTATILGWKVLRYTPDQFQKYLYLRDINLILENKWHDKGII
jgi:very-short-patch-repair endonuclease